MRYSRVSNLLLYRPFVIALALLSAFLSYSVGSAAGDGIVVSPTITVYSGLGSQGDNNGISVAFDSNNSRFLAVWSDYSGETGQSLLYAQLVGPGGSLYGGLIPVSSRTGCVLPRVGFDGSSGRFLVVWQDYFREDYEYVRVYGRFVNADGSLHGSEFVISPAGHELRWKLPRVRHDSINGRFLVIWIGDSLPHDVYGQFVSDAGALDGGMMQFTSFASDYYLAYPDIEFDPGSGRFLMTWANQADGYVYAYVLNGDGSRYGDLVTVGYYGLGKSHISSLSADPANGRFLQLWTANKGRLINDDGSLYGTEITLFSTPDYIVDTVSSVFDPANDRFLSIGVIQYPYQGIVGQFIKPDGSIDGADFPILEEPIYNYCLPAASGSRQTGSLIAWQSLGDEPSDENDIFARIVTDGRTPCFGDSEPDSDVDGTDLYHLISSGGLDIGGFAESFGRTGCL